MRHLAITGLIFIFATGAAKAHGIFGAPPGFVAGLSHPLTVSAHVLVTIALALLVGQHGLSVLRLPAYGFGGGLVVGLAGSMAGIYGDVTQMVLLAIAGLTGLTVLASLNLHTGAVASLAAAAGFLIGLDSGVETDSLSVAGATLTGTGLAVFLLFIYLAALTAVIYSDKPDWMKIGVRVIGSWITAIAALILSLAFVG